MRVGWPGMVCKAREGIDVGIRMVGVDFGRIGGRLNARVLFKFLHIHLKDIIELTPSKRISFQVTTELLSYQHPRGIGMSLRLS